MQQTLEHDHPNVVRLTARARSRGAAIRRRKRLATLGGSLALLTVVAGLATSGPLRPGHSTTAATDAPPALTTLADGSEILQGAIANVAPELAVSDVTTLTVSGSSARSSLKLTPYGATTGSLMTLTYGPATGPTPDSATCEAQGSASTGCHVETLPDGSTLLTYQLHAGRGRNRGWVYDAMRFVNGYAYGVDIIAPVNAQDSYVSPMPALTKDQLVAIMSQPVWTSVQPL
jgi:hypothetical protein